MKSECRSVTEETRKQRLILFYRWFHGSEILVVSG